MPCHNASEAAGSHRVTRCVGKLTFVQKATENGMVETTVSVEQLTRDEALDVAGVTRCRDCKKFHPDQTDHEYRDPWYCDRWRTDRVNPDGFCAWGTPSEEDA